MVEPFFVPFDFTVLIPLESQIDVLPECLAAKVKHELGVGGNRLT